MMRKTTEQVIRRGISAVCLILCTVIVSGQPAAALATLQQKYPKRAVVISQRKLDVSIDLVNNAPQISLDEVKELVILADNSTFLADTREYFNNHYDVSKLEAYSLVPDQNQYRKLPVSKFTKTVEIDNSVFLDDQYAYRFTFPSVGMGTRLVTRSTATTAYAYLPVMFDFGSALPAENLVLTVSCPKNIRINYHLFGKDTAVIHFKFTEKGNRNVYEWSADNPKSYERDEEAPALRYFIPHIIIQIAGYTLNGQYYSVIGSLKDLYSFNYSNISALPLAANSDILDLTDSIVADCRDDRDRVRCIFRWVQKNIKYVAIEDGDNGIIPREASLVLKRRYGDCKDKTSLLVAMIRSQNLMASYAWIGSRSLPYKYSVFPSVVNDDHMVAVWWDQEKPVILDGTTYTHRMEDVPAFIQGKECLIEKGKDDFLLFSVPIAEPGMNRLYDSLAIRLQGDTIIGTGYAVFTGEQKASMIAGFDGKDSSDWAAIVQQQLPKASNKLSVTAVKISDIQNLDQPFTIRYEFLLPDYLVRTNKFTYVNLYLNRFLQQTKIRADRWIPVESDMTLDQVFVCSLSIPGDVTMGKLPDDSGYKNSWFGFTEHYTQQQNHVLLTSHVTINFQVIEGIEIDRFREMLSLLNKNYLNSIPFEKTNAL